VDLVLGKRDLEVAAGKREQDKHDAKKIRTAGNHLHSHAEFCLLANHSALLSNSELIRKCVASKNISSFFANVPSRGTSASSAAPASPPAAAAPAKSSLPMTPGERLQNANLPSTSKKRKNNEAADEVSTSKGVSKRRIQQLVDVFRVVDKRYAEQPCRRDHAAMTAEGGANLLSRSQKKWHHFRISRKGVSP
jgi:hypothetical protein